MSNDIQIFEHVEFGEVRTVQHEGEWWFVAKDICDVLGFADAGQATRGLDEDEKTTLQIMQDGSNYKSMMVIINESGLYSLILRSRKPEAKKFKRWVTHEVLPSIRKTGSYNLEPKMKDMIELLPKDMGDACAKLSAAYQSIDILKSRADNYEATANLLAQCEENVTVGSFAKLLYKQGINVGRNTLFNWLRKDGFVMKTDRYDRNHPTQKALKDGLLVLEEDVVERDNGANFITQRILITPAGQIFFANFYKDRVEEVEEAYSEFPAHIQDYFRFNKKYNITPEVKDFFTIPKNHPVND